MSSRVTHLLATALILVVSVACEESAHTLDQPFAPSFEEEQPPEPPYVNQEAYVGRLHNDALRAAFDSLQARSVALGASYTRQQAIDDMRAAIDEYFLSQELAADTFGFYGYYSQKHAAQPYATASQQASDGSDDPFITSSPYYTPIPSAQIDPIDDVIDAIDASATLGEMIAAVDQVEQRYDTDPEQLAQRWTLAIAAVADSSGLYWESGDADWSGLCERSPLLCNDPVASGPYLAKVDGWGVLASDVTGILSGLRFSGSPHVAALGGALSSAVSILTQLGS